MGRGIFCALIFVMATQTVEGRAEFQANTYIQHHQTYPAVAMNPAGDFIVAWRSHFADGRGGGVYARHFHADGTPAGGEFAVSDAGVDVANWSPGVGLSAGGDAVIAWVAVEDGDRDIMARMFDAQGQPLTDAFEVNGSPDEAIQSAPCVSMNAAGRFVVAWSSSMVDGDRIRQYVAGRVFSADGSAVSDEFPIGELSQAHWPDAGMDDSGRFVVTWVHMGEVFSPEDGEQVMFRRFEADGTPLDDGVMVTGDLCNRACGASVAMDSTGRFAITWANGPFPNDIIMQTFDAEGLPITEPFVVNTYLDGHQTHPRVAADGAGEYLVVWDSEGQDGQGHGVFGQLCNNRGELHGGELAMNSHASGRQWYPNAAMAADGEYVVVWTSEGQDGSGYGIFGETGAR